MQTVTPAKAAKLLGCHPRHVRWLIKKGYIKSKLVWSDKAGRECNAIDRKSVLAYAKRKPKMGWKRGVPRSPISTRTPEVTVEYDQNGRRVTKHFVKATLARRFYAFQDREGNNPKVVKGRQQVASSDEEKTSGK